MKTTLSPRFWLALTLFGLIGQVAWVVENMYLNVFLYNIFRASAADISLMVALSAVSAAVTTVLIGALSDRIGKRRLFICGGYILWGVSIFGFVCSMWVSAAALGISVVIALDCLMTFFGSSANDAAFNAWLTDSTDNTNRGSAEGVNAMMPLVAILVVFGGFMFFDLKLTESWTWIFTIIGAVVTLIGILGFFLIQEPKKCVASETGYWKNVIYGFRPSTVKSNPSLYFYLILFVLFNISIQIFMPYLILYYEVSLGMSDYVFVMAPAIILASVATVLWGRVYDKKGFGFSSAVSLVALSLGYVILFLMKQTPAVFVGSLLMMCGYLCGMAVFGAKIRDLMPGGKAGMLQGVRICAQVLLPGVIGPAIGAAVLANAEKIVNSDGTESFVPNESIFLAALVVVLVLALILLLVLSRKKPRTVRLTTPFEDEMTGDEWAKEYPRPQMKRESYVSLCGDWTLFVEQKGSLKKLGSIRVPFSPETELSGICRTPKKGERYVYERSFSSAKDANKRLLLHFGAVDQIAEVSVNGMSVGSHTGGYLPFTFDITDYLKAGENLLRVRVTDELDTELAYGKQRKKRGGMWYTPISGIWQPVWLECVPKSYFSSLRLTPSLDRVTVETVGGAAQKTLTLQTETGEKAYCYEGDRFELILDDPILWTPEHPYLYRFTLTDGEDRVESYFALRTVETKTVNRVPRICLNGKPYFFHGLLDQGYYSDGIYLPATPSGYRFDISEMKRLGFNMLRKHIKIEPEIFYYECDRQGMIVFQDMLNNGKYNFLIDTALPTVGLKQGIAHHASKKRRADFENGAKETLELLYNHPSVCYYTIFNEGWGQYRDAERIYRELKAKDPTRIYDTASGWFRVKESDVQSEHVYFKKIDLKVGKLPLVLSEFGGYSCKLEGHSFNLDKTYGYRTCETTERFEADLLSLYRTEILPAIGEGLCAAVLTQVSDVEDETNGLLTYDRRVTKVSALEMQKLAEELFQAFDEK